MSEEYYALNRPYNPNPSPFAPKSYSLIGAGKSTGKAIRVRTKEDDRFPNEIEITDGLWGKALQVDEKTVSAVLKSMSEGKVSKDLVQMVETKGYNISYDAGGA
jgi:hypothetical protein